MKEILKYTFLDNTVEAYLLVVGTVLLMLIIKRLISRFLASKLLGFITSENISQKKIAFLNLVVKPIERFLIVFIAYTALDRLTFPEAFKIKFYHKHLNTEDIVSGIGTIIIIVVFIRLCIRIIEFIAQLLEEKASQNNDKIDNQLIVFFKDFFKVILITIGFLLVLRFAFNKDIGNLLTGLSIVGAALALATRESLENLIASFIIFFDKPFITGDLVKVQNFTGVIEKIGLRSTRIRTEQKTYISVPNKQMVDTIIDNITLRTERKVELRLELSLSATAEQLKLVSNEIKNLLQQQKDITNSIVYLQDTGKNAHIIAVDYFTVMPQPFENFIALREEINLSVIDLLEKNKIELAAKSMDVTVQNKN
ncbi:Low conductance mechanosensitive channel YnaI [mine drainage metagenome]|uniref:Low conductance mechanosensitive channel YnaI n=1 Tax=mine drainage metagenome TaxID=410659 RepID=A0A1J5SAL4_9ZZZZ